MKIRKLKRNKAKRSQNKQSAEKYHNLLQKAANHQHAGRIDKAVGCYQRALGLSAGDAHMHNELGTLYQLQGDVGKAQQCYQRAAELDPDLGAAQYNLGNIFAFQGKVEQALACFRQAAAIDPNNADALTNIGNLLKDQWKLKEAEEYLGQAVSINPDHAEKVYNLGVVRNDQGRREEAVNCYRRALKLDPGNASMHSTLLSSMNYEPAVSCREQFTAASQWWEQHGASLSKRVSYGNEPDPDRRLRIGYVSPDLRMHSVSYFFLPLIASHNREEVEVFCYADVMRPDETTEKIRGLSDHWCSAVRMSHKALVARIQADRIDILVDLAGHTLYNRLLVFARKPSPIQMTWLGYPNITGLPVIDYRLTDEIADPEGVSDAFYSETLVRMDQGFLCYFPPEDSPEVGGLPFNKNGFITFGSFNKLDKINEDVVATWSKILEQVPDSRLLLKNKAFTDEFTKNRYFGLFAKHGIDSKRLRMIAYIPSRREHFELYNEIDIGLDTFPYNGTTTTCEALWMGVPVVGLLGDRHASRTGASILTTLEMTELIADTPGEYVELAVSLAKYPDRVAEYRQALRNRMTTSRLCDPKGFARGMEKFFREVWRKWCEASREGQKP